MNRRVQVAQGIKRKPEEHSDAPLPSYPRVSQINQPSENHSCHTDNFISQSTKPSQTANNIPLKEELLKCLNTINQFQTLLNSNCSPAQKTKLISSMKDSLSKLPRIDNSHVYDSNLSDPNNVTTQSCLGKLRELQSLLLGEPSRVNVNSATDHSSISSNNATLHPDMNNLNTGTGHQSVNTNSNQFNQSNFGHSSEKSTPLVPYESCQRNSESNCNTSTSSSHFHRVSSATTHSNATPRAHINDNSESSSSRAESLGAFGLASVLNQINKEKSHIANEQISEVSNNDVSQPQPKPQINQSVKKIRKANPFAKPISQADFQPENSSKPPESEEDSDSEDDPRIQSMKQFGVGALLSAATSGASSRPLTSKTLKPVRKPTNRPPPPSNPPKTILNELKNDSIVKALTEFYPDVPQNLLDIFTNKFCTFCMSPVNSLRPAISHYNGRKHQAKLEFYGEPVGVFDVDTDEDLLSLNLNDDKKIAVDDVNKCDICGVTFDSQTNVQDHYSSESHIRQCQKLGVRCLRNGYYCELCEITTTSAESLNHHLNGKKHRTITVLNKKPVLSSANKSESLYRCDLCQVTCSSDETIELHYFGKRHRDSVEMLNRMSNMCNTQRSFPSTEEYDRWLFGLPSSMIARHLEEIYADMPVVLMDLITMKFCHFCQLGVNSIQMAIDHFNSQLHQRKMQFYQIDCKLYVQQYNPGKALLFGQDLNNYDEPVQRISLSKRPTSAVRKLLEPLNFPENLVDLFLDQSCIFCECNFEFVDEVTSHYNTTEHQTQLQNNCLPLGRFTENVDKLFA